MIIISHEPFEGEKIALRLFKLNVSWTDIVIELNNLHGYYMFIVLVKFLVFRCRLAFRRRELFPSSNQPWIIGT